eukprot:16215-Heterococcus_DN1.PRE.1
MSLLHIVPRYQQTQATQAAQLMDCFNSANGSIEHTLSIITCRSSEYFSSAVQFSHLTAQVTDPLVWAAGEGKHHLLKSYQSPLFRQLAKLLLNVAATLPLELFAYMAGHRNLALWQYRGSRCEWMHSGQAAMYSTVLVMFSV